MEKAIKPWQAILQPSTERKSSDCSFNPRTREDETLS